MKYSIIIPVYKNQESIPRLLDTLAYINKELEEELEAVFVVDGSPDFCFSMLREALPLLPYQARLIALSRNFGSMAAIRTGLAAVQGVFVSVMAADLQEPPGLVLQCFRALDNDECDVAVGTRISRNDSFITKITSRLFWWFYKRYIMPDMPEGGVDIFACNQKFKTQLLTLEESRSSLIALIFWLGFRRKTIGYERQARQEGRYARMFRKKVEYLMDSSSALQYLHLRLIL